MAVVSNNHDRFMIKHADVSISLQKTIVNSDIQASTDISIKSLYGLTYLLFKHGS